MRHPFSVLILLVATCLFAEQHSSANSSGGILRVFPLNQSWSIEDSIGISREIRELSTQVFFSYPVVDRLNLAFNGARVSTGGDSKSISGFTDVQISANYFLTSFDLVLSLGVNLPSGESQLSEPDFQTSLLLSDPIFRFQVPNMGQGWRVSPGVSWAKKINDRLAVGIGAAYQAISEYKFRKEITETYDPGDEWAVAGGFDMRLSRATLMSCDLLFTFYGTDKLENVVVIEAGNKMVLKIGFLKYFDRDKMELLARYRNRTKNTVIATETDMKFLPNEVELKGQYYRFLSQQVGINFIAEARIYESLANARFSDGPIWGLGILPAFDINSNVSIPLRLKYLWGNFKDDYTVSGIEAGAGVSVSF
ncbi:MAG: hypothetical protein GWN16_07585 [Calditrichae bacterium]|nr:hypothetical protein [Calditrichia bacterium]